MVRGEIKIGKSPSMHLVLGRGLPGGLGPPCSWEVGQRAQLQGAVPGRDGVTIMGLGPSSLDLCEVPPKDGA